MYESVTDKAEPAAEHEDFQVMFDSPCSECLTDCNCYWNVYQVAKEKLAKRSKEICVDDGWFNILNDCFKFVNDACYIGCSWEHSVEVCKQLGSKLKEPRTDETISKLKNLGSQTEKF